MRILLRIKHGRIKTTEERGYLDEGISVIWF